jgi:hypothetical protein
MDTKLNKGKNATPAMVPENVTMAVNSPPSSGTVHRSDLKMEI